MSLFSKVTTAFHDRGKAVPLRTEDDVGLLADCDNVNSYDHSSELSHHARTSNWSSIIPWALALVMAGINIYLLSENGHIFNTQHSAVSGSFGEGFETELGPARDKIRVVQLSRSGQTNVTSDGQFYFVEPGPVPYVGDPVLHPEVDANWERILHGTWPPFRHVRLQFKHRAPQDVYLPPVLAPTRPCGYFQLLVTWALQNRRHRLMGISRHVLSDIGRRGSFSLGR